MELGQLLQFGSLQLLLVLLTQFLCSQKSWNWWGLDILDGLSIATSSSSQVGRNWQQTLNN
nr:hypothetical protein Iba_chr04aCG16020 [Ipomoea batatas]